LSLSEADVDAGEAVVVTVESDRHLSALHTLISEIIEPAAARVDRLGEFPRTSVDALAGAGLLGLISSTDVGGMGGDLSAATAVVQQLARACGSTAMVVCMHYVGAAVIEKYGPRDARIEIATGRHLTTLALSEAGSRGQFWVPIGTARSESGAVALDAHKSWITSAGEADSYVWSSRALVGDGLTLWLVPSGSEGLTVTTPFDGLGLRGNASSPVTAQRVLIPTDGSLGPDGGGGDIVMGVVLPWFQLLTAGHALGTMEAATAKTIAHVSGTRFEHTGRSLAELPTVRANVARMEVKTRQVAALIGETLESLRLGDPDAQLQVLAVKAAAGEAVTEVTDLAMRVCGGAAFRRELGIERRFRDARASTVMAPTTDVLYDFIGRAVTGLPLFD
jgi:alkylation response protein AidB-like acyl-CoA dehydrogenase